MAEARVDTKHRETRSRLGRFTALHTREQPSKTLQGSQGDLMSTETACNVLADDPFAAGHSSSGPFRMPRGYTRRGRRGRIPDGPRICDTFTAEGRAQALYMSTPRTARVHLVQRGLGVSAPAN